jgi:uncharacterized protein YlaN (UPF0358 family)
MKNLKIIILGMLFINNLYSQQQNKDFTYCNAKIDSIFTELSVKTYKYPKNIDSIFAKTKISEKEQTKIVQKIWKMFEQEEYTNLYILGHCLLDEMWKRYYNYNIGKVSQQLLDVYLKYYFYPVKPSYEDLIDIRYYDLNRRKNYTVKSKQRIFELLKDGKNEKEFELWLKYRQSRITDDRIEKGSTYWKIAESLMKKLEIQNDTVCMQIRDSIITESVYNAAKQDFDELKIFNYLILMAGFLDMKECIPVLQSQLPEAIEKDDMWQSRERAIRYALARLGDKEQQNYVIENMMGYEQYFDTDYFSYFRDDEMMWKFIDVNYHSNQMIMIYSEGDGISSALKTMSDVYPYVKNISKKLAYPYTSKDINDDYKWAKEFYEWLMANKNKIKFDYDGEKKGFW